MSHKKGVPLLSVIISIGLFVGSVFLGVVPAYAADGSGTNSVSPTSTDVSSTGNEFTFAFTAAETMNSGGVNIEIPSGFSAPQGTAGTAGYTTVSTTGTIADVLDTADSATGWSAGSACSSGAPTADVVVFHEGTASIRCTNGNESNNDQWYKNITSEDWSTYTTVGFWIRTTGALVSGDLEFVYDDTANVESDIEALELPAVSVNTWTYVTLSFGATTRTAIVSYGFRAAGASAIDSKTIYIDDILLGPGSLTFPSSSIDARLLQLASSGTVTVTYGSGGGASGVTVPGTFGTYTATTTSRFNDSGTLTNIASHPTITVKNPTPVLTTISPTSTEVESGTTTITLTGSGFVASSVARWNGSDRTTTFINSTTLDMTVPASDLTVAGTSTVTVFNPTPGGGTSSGQSFVVRNRVPAVTSLSPNEAFIGDATTTVTVTGTNFVSGATANWNGSARATAFVNSTTIDITVATTDLATAGTSTVTVTNPAPGGGTSTTSAAFVVKYRTPTITSNTPDPVFVNETTILTITGTNFYANSVVTFAGTTLTSTTTGVTLITVTLPAATASTTGEFSLAVTNQTPGGGSAATTTNIHYRAPTISTVAPNPIFINEEVSITITGANFYGVSVVKYNDTIISSTTTDSTHISATIPSLLVTATGSSTITVTNPAPGGGTATATIAVQYRAPTLTSINPTEANVGSGNTLITLTGTNFYAISVARFDGSDLATTYVSPTSLTATIPAASLATVGTSTVTVFNTTPGGGASGGQTFIRRNPTPSVTAVDPSEAFIEDPDTVITITGTGFVSTTVIRFDGDDIATTFVNNTTATATISAVYLTTAGTSTITAFNPAPGGGVSTTSVAFLRKNRAPIITSLVPNTVEEGSATTSLTINGANFIGSTTVTFDGTPLVLSSTSTTVLETSIPASLLATFGTSTVAVTNPAPGGGTATSSFIIARGAVKFVFSGAPYSGTVDAPVTVTVQAQRENGSVVTNYQSDVTVNVGGSASPSSVLINIINGSGTTTISNTAAETVTLSLSDTQTTGLDVTATTSATFTHGALTQFALAGPATLSVGNRAAFTATRKDQFGNPVTTGLDTTAYFYTTSTSSSAVFYNASIAGSTVTSAIMASGTSTATVWYYDEEPGLYTITVSDNGTAPDGAAGIDDATSTIAVNAVATRFVIIDPTDGTVDAPITVTVQAQDNLGRLITDYENDVTLIASSTSGLVNATTTLINIINGSGTTTISNTAAETVTLSLSDTQATGLNVASSTQDVVFAPGAVAQFSLTHSGDMEQNTRKEFIAGRKDQYGNFVSASTTPAYLYASPTSTTKFYDAASGGNEITSITFAPENATTSFWFYSNTPATTTVTVSDNATTPDGDTGINDASNEILVTPTAVRFEIVDPTDGTVDAAITVTVRALDEFGQIVLSFTEDITLLVTGSAVANPVLVDLESGVGTTQVSNTVAETVTLSLSDTQSTGLVATSTQDVVFGVGAFAKLNLNNVVNATAGELTAYTVTRTDQYNNQITSGSITVALSATPTSTPGVFYASNSTSSAQITSIAINSGSASAQFWYYNEVAGSYQVTAQSGAVIGYDDIVIDPAIIAKFTMNNRTSMNPGSRVQYTVVRKDTFNNLVTASATTAYLYADPAGAETAFYDAATNGNMITSITIANGQSSQDMWYYEETDGTHTITASDNATAPDGVAGILDATDSILVQTATGTRFVFNPDPNPLTVTVGNSSLVTIQVQDDFGNVDTNYQNDITLVTGVTSVSGSGLTNGEALIDIVNGEGTITLTNTVAEIVNLALSDSQTTGLTVSDTASITWTPGAVSQFTITDQTSMVAGTSTVYVVARKDQYGNFVTSGSNLVYLYTNSTGANARFQATETGTSSISFVTIANGFASTTFWYYDEDAGTWDITASDNAAAPDGTTGIADASDSLIVTPAPVVADRYVILNPADAGLNEVTVVIIQTQDADGALDTTIQEDIYLVFSTSSVNVTGKVNDRVLVDIVDGVGTVQIHDTVAETVQLSLARVTGSTSTLAITSTQDVMFFVRQGPAVGFAGGGVYVAPAATVSFIGRAYPGARVSLFARIGGQDITLERDIEVRADGTFTIDFSGALRGLESFGLAIFDKDGKIAQVKTYTMDKVTRATEEKNLYIAPTAGLVQRTVTIGNNVGITGSAAPGSIIKAEVDGQSVAAQAQVRNDGTYRLLVNTREFDYGGHIIRVKQRDKAGIESDWSPLKVFTVTRTLVTRADLNNNGAIDIGDWSIFLTRFGSTNEGERMQVDLNNDGKVDISDFSIFIRSAVSR